MKSRLEQSSNAKLEGTSGWVSNDCATRRPLNSIRARCRRTILSLRRRQIRYRILETGKEGAKGKRGMITRLDGMGGAFRPLVSAENRSAGRKEVGTNERGSIVQICPS